MTKEEILQGNVLIAEFMGETNLTKVQHIGYNISVGRGKKSNVEAAKLVPYIKNYKGLWDTIMPVAKKIIDLIDPLTKKLFVTTAGTHQLNICNAITDFDIEKTFEAVVTSIQWYNNSNK